MPFLNYKPQDFEKSEGSLQFRILSRLPLWNCDAQVSINVVNYLKLLSGVGWG